MREMCQPCRVTNTPVCVVGLGLIGGSVMRAAAAAGREVFGYNRSIDAVQAAKFDGFDATENLDKALARAADSNALIRSEEHTSELQSPDHLVCRLLLEKKKKQMMNS